MSGYFSTREDMYGGADLLYRKWLRVCIHVTSEAPLSNPCRFEKARTGLLSELFQLAEDETQDVKNTAIQTIISLLDFFDHKYRIREVLPKFLHWMQHPAEDSKPILISMFGEYFYKLSRKFPI